MLSEDDFPVEGRVVVAGLPYHGQVDDGVLTLPGEAGTFTLTNAANNGCSWVAMPAQDPAPASDLDEANGYQWLNAFVLDKGAFGMGDLDWVYVDANQRAWLLRCELTPQATTYPGLAGDRAVRVVVKLMARFGAFGDVVSEVPVIAETGLQLADTTFDYGAEMAASSRFGVFQASTNAHSLIQNSDGSEALVHCYGVNQNIGHLETDLFPVAILKITVSGDYVYDSESETWSGLTVLVTEHFGSDECIGDDTTGASLTSGFEGAPIDGYAWERDVDVNISVIRAFYDSSDVAHYFSLSYRREQYEEWQYSNYTPDYIRYQSTEVDQKLWIDGVEAVNHHLFAEEGESVTSSATWTYNGTVVLADNDPTFYIDAISNFLFRIYDSRTVGLTNVQLSHRYGKWTHGASAPLDTSEYAAFDWYDGASIVTASTPVAFI